MLSAERSVLGSDLQNPSSCGQIRAGISTLDNRGDLPGKHLRLSHVHSTMQPRCMDELRIGSKEQPEKVKVHSPHRMGRGGAESKMHV